MQTKQHDIKKAGRKQKKKIRKIGNEANRKSRSTFIARILAIHAGPRFPVSLVSNLPYLFFFCLRPAFFMSCFFVCIVLLNYFSFSCAFPAYVLLSNFINCFFL